MDEFCCCGLVRIRIGAVAWATLDLLGICMCLLLMLAGKVQDFPLIAAILFPYLASSLFTIYGASTNKRHYLIPSIILSFLHLVCYALSGNIFVGFFIFAAIVKSGASLEFLGLTIRVQEIDKILSAVQGSIILIGLCFAFFLAFDVWRFTVITKCYKHIRKEKWMESDGDKMLLVQKHENSMDNPVYILETGAFPTV